ncbi:MAG TPA: prepilin peptidase [Dongiaceae bacterium]|jgi:prepilin peptidase CpaA
MPFSAWIQLAAASLTIVLLIAAGVTDITRYRIPNAIVCAIVAVFLVGALFNLSWPVLGWSAAAALGMFLLGAGLFALRLFGGGDVKLIAAMALWTSAPSDLLRFLLVMSVAGGLLGTVWLVRRRRQHAAMANGSTSEQRKLPNKIPYGVAIAVAGLDFFLTSPHSPFAALLPWAS